MILNVFHLLAFGLSYVLSDKIYGSDWNSKYYLKKNHLNSTEITKLSNVINRKSGYWCNEQDNLPLLQVELVYKDVEISSSHTTKHSLHKFSAKRFLASLRNKRLAIIGDSLGLQLYSGIDARLDHHQLQQDDIKTHKDKHSILQYKDGHRNHHDSNARYYPQYNATIMWCHDPWLEDFYIYKSGVNSDCGRDVIASDFILFSFGAWYKPMFRPMTRGESSSSSITTTTTTTTGSAELPRLPDFLDDMMESERLVNRQMRLIKQKMLEMNPSAKLLWRLHPHVGNIDEYNHQAFGLNVTDLSHTDGKAWSTTSRDSVWVRRINDIIRYNAYRFKNILIDWFGLSYLYMDYFSNLNMSVPVYVHVDSLHYCAAGVPRGSMLLLHDAIMKASIS